MTNTRFSLPLAIGGAVCVIGLSILYAPKVREAMEQRIASEIQREDAIFCERLLIPPASPNFHLCTRNLAEIRRLHGIRLAVEAAGIL